MPAKACAQALASARAIFDYLKSDEATANCNCSVGIAFGQVTYGNVGSRERLDFTVIGQAANVAARLCDHGKTAGYGIVLSENAVRGAKGLSDLGDIALHNVSEPVRAFGVDVQKDV